ncbi:DUF1768-domain-containing protein [Mytilinidion resinicola]|uniref:DUF1768-domain-containing protein n=1 Tax=Mytilinidion resinicola TaxID=574789 RepID=A0A6A6YZW5_9PEZI|nr:DUF1768-domain-containing protein [Mytilinidion resinicola]KAF2814462.1 DUF1768-domain-containing protein [Mytilinidion resinicola]
MRKSKGKGKATATSSTTSSASPDAESTGAIFFWHEYGHAYGFLSQWYESEWEHEGASYSSAEMWMMVSKARLFGDEDVAQRMLIETDPKTHKVLGRQVTDFDPKVWDDNKLRIVEEGNWHKFTKSKQAVELQKLLLATGDRELVEASPFDKIWGVGFAEKGAERNRHKWGQNLLGKALMTVRERLREHAKAASTTE